MFDLGALVLEDDCAGVLFPGPRWTAPVPSCPSSSLSCPPDPTTGALSIRRALRSAEAEGEYRKLGAVGPANPTRTMNLVSNLGLSGQMGEARRQMSQALPATRTRNGPTLAAHLAPMGEMEDANEVRKAPVARRAARSTPSANAKVVDPSGLKTPGWWSPHSGPSGLPPGIALVPEVRPAFPPPNPRRP
jgi:hypothetical protein